MNHTMKLLERARVGLLGAGVALASLFLASDAGAGAQYGDYEYCSTGFCEGTFGGFRNSSNAGDFVNFWYFTNSAGANEPGFLASYAGSYFSCEVVSGSTTLFTAWPTVMAPTTFFYITWNSSGQCTTLETFNASYYNSPY